MHNCNVHISIEGRLSRGPGFEGCMKCLYSLQKFECTSLSCLVLTLSCRSGLAPALESSSTTLWWPLELACTSAILPFCMIKWVDCNYKRIV